MVKPAAAAAVLLSAVVALAACSPNQNPSSQPGTLPPVWTGSTSPGAPSSPAPGASQQLKAQLVTPNGTPVANVTLDFANGYATITVETVASGILTPGFHGLGIHSVGKCEANSVAPSGGAPGDFLSAGGYYQAPGQTGHPSSGDLSSLQVRSDGAGKLLTTSDAFTAADLLGAPKTAIIIDASSDNFGNIPPERYQQVNGTPGPDQSTLDTGDAGKRVACGVITG